MKFFCVNYEFCGTSLYKDTEKITVLSCPACQSTMLPYEDHETPSWLMPASSAPAIGIDDSYDDEE